MTVATPAQVNESQVLEKLKLLMNEAHEVRVNIDDIYVNRSSNTRAETSYTPESMNDMKTQIKSVGGLLSPLLIYAIDPDPATDNKPYCLLAGYRRTLAIIELASEPGGEHFGKDVKAVVITGDHGATAQTAVQLLENIGRRDLNPMEQSNGIAEMLEDKSVTQKAIADFFGMSEVQVSNLLKLQHLPQEIQDLISEGKLTFSAARVLVRDVPESSWPEYAKFAVDLPYGEFMKKVEALKSKASGTQPAEGAAADGKVSTGKDQQRRTELLKATAVKDSYIPFLLKKLEAVKGNTEKKYTEADLVAARLDTFKAVMVQNSVLGEEIKPFLQEQILAKENEEKNKAASSAEDTFFRGLIKEIEEIYKREVKVDPLNPGKKFELSTAISAVLQRVSQLSDDAVSKLGFPIDVKNMDAVRVRLSEVYKQVGIERQDAAKKKAEAAAKKEKEAAEAKAKAEADAKAAGTAAPAEAAAS